MKNYNIHLVRHGLTESNENGLYSGSTDSNLSEKGKEILLDLKSKFEYPTSSVLYCSPLVRCIQTAEILFPDNTPIIIDQLQECSFGDWEGKGISELKTSPVFMGWIKGEEDISPPNGESIKQLKERVCTAFDKIVTGMMKTGQTDAIIVTHGGVMMAILSEFGLPKAKYFKWLVDNGCGYSVRITPSLWMRDKVMEVVEQLPYGHKSQLKGDFKFMTDFAKSTNQSE